MEYFIWFVLACWTLYVYGQSPPPCLDASDVCTGEGNKRECSNRGLTDVPCHFPCETRAINLTKNSIGVLYGDAFKMKRQCLQQNLEMLDLSDNRITTVESDCFEPLRNLQKLFLSRNRLEPLMSGVFQSNKVLKELRLDHNRLTRVPYLKDLHQLQTLDLSENEIQSISKYDFNNLTQLDVLNLSGNQIETLPDYSIYLLPALRILIITEHMLTNLMMNAFSFPATSSSSITVLDLTDGSLADIADSSFSDLQRLERLSIAGNKLTLLRRGMFNGLISIHSLDLSHNKLSDMQGSVFMSMSTLEYLDLSVNHLTSVSQDLFAGIDNLHYLLLANNLLLDVGDALGVLPFLRTINLLDNRIANLSNQAFVGNSKLEDIELGGNQLTQVPHAILEANSDLKGNLGHLDLHGNQISTVNSQSFGSLTYLEELDLSSNVLDTVEPNSFINLPDLIKLRLNGNQLTTVHRSAIDGNLKLKNIYLHDNPWMCDCDVIGLWRHLRANTSRVDIYSPAAILCQNPRTLNKRKLSDVSMDSTYNCQDMPIVALSQTDIIIISAATGGVLLLVIIALVIVVVRYKNKGEKEEREPAPKPQNVYDDGLYLTPSVAGSQSNLAREESHKYDVPFPLLKTNEAHTYESPPTSIKPINHPYDAPLTPTIPKKLYKSKSDQKINQGYDDDGYAQADEIMN